jgi:hypothetical protein
MADITVLLFGAFCACAGTACESAAASTATGMV